MRSQWETSGRRVSVEEGQTGGRRIAEIGNWNAGCAVRLAVQMEDKKKTGKSGCRKSETSAVCGEVRRTKICLFGCCCFCQKRALRSGSCAVDFSLVSLISLISLTTMTAEADVRSCPRFRPHALWLGLARPEWRTFWRRRGAGVCWPTCTLASVLAAWEGLQPIRSKPSRARSNPAGTGGAGTESAENSNTAPSVWQYLLGKGRLSLLRTQRQHRQEAA